VARLGNQQAPGTGGSSADHRIVAEILGYSVEVFNGDQVIASATQPADVKRKIELLKDNEKGR